jgi:anti-sigma-K factor RskA
MEGLAGEYVLGTLDASERAEIEARLQREPALAAAVAQWAERLQPLADLAGEVEPSAALWPKIEARIRDENDDRVVRLRRSVRRWRFATAVALFAASILAVVIIGEREVAPPPGASYVAILGGEGGQPAFVASVDTGARTIRLRRVGEAPPPDKSFELWQVPASGPTVSLGTADAISDLKALNVSLKPGELLAISVEPKGGSPTGKATGPVVFTGTLLPAE